MSVCVLWQVLTEGKRALDSGNVDVCAHKNAAAYLKDLLEGIFATPFKKKGWVRGSELKVRNRPNHQNQGNNM